MTTFSKQLLSASTHGRGILVVATTSPGTPIHIPPSGTSSMDEITLWAANSSSSDVLLTLEWGGTTAGDLKIQSIPARKGNQIIASKELLRNGLTLAAYAGTGSAIAIFGYVNRITG